MSYVIVVHDNPYSPKDFASAEDFGELKFLFNTHIHTHNLPRIFGLMRDRMRGVTKEDWLIPAGAPALIAMAGAIFKEKTGQINLLVWDRHQQKYIPMEIKDA